MPIAKPVAARKLALFAGVAGLVSIAMAAPEDASAQTASQAYAAPQEIVVTAQKRSERLQDVPASVSVLNMSALADQGLVQFEDYTARVPGLSITGGRAGQAQVTLRGITTGPAQSASATSFYVDEAPVGSVNAYTGGSSITPDLDPADLSRLEVLKGPQGTLYGAGSVGGLLKFVTAPPNFTNFGGHLMVSGTDAANGGDGFAVRGLVNVPLIQDQVVLRASAFDRTDPGFIDNVANGAKDVNKADVKGGRLLIAAKPASHVEVDLSAIIQDTNSHGLSSEDVNPTTLQPLYGDLTQRRYTAEPGSVRLNFYNATVKADEGAFHLVSSTTFQTIKTSASADGTNGYGVLLGALFKIPNLGIRTNQILKTERFSQEFRADSSLFAGKLDYQLGAYFTHESDKNQVPSFNTFSTATGAPIAFPNIVTAAIDSRYTEYSGFANATYHLTGKFDMLAGLRYSHDEQHYYQDYAGLLVGAERRNTAGETGDIVTYLVSPRFKLNADNMIYARISSGYRPGGPNAVPPPSVAAAPNTFAPDKLTSYEVGYKASLFSRLLTVDTAVFYTDWNDIQIETSAGGFNFFVNGGSAVSQGAEITARLNPMAGLGIGFEGAYTDAHLTSAAPAAGGIDGDRMPFVPRFTGSLNADYTWPIAPGWDGVLNGSINYVGSRISNYTMEAPKKVADYTTVNLRAGIDHGAWSLSVYGKNLTDARGVLALATEGLTPAVGPYAAALIQPRIVGVELSYRF